MLLSKLGEEKKLSFYFHKFTIADHDGQTPPNLEVVVAAKNVSVEP